MYCLFRYEDADVMTLVGTMTDGLLLSVDNISASKKTHHDELVVLCSMFHEEAHVEILKE